MRKSRWEEKMGDYMSWMIFVQIGIFVMGTGSLATWIMLSRNREATVGETSSSSSI